MESEDTIEIIDTALVSLASQLEKVEEYLDTYSDRVQQLKSLASIKIQLSELALKQQEFALKEQSAKADQELRQQEMDFKVDEKEENLKLRMFEVDLKVKALDLQVREFEEKSKVNVNSVLPLVGNLLGIFGILHYERFQIITSKALNFVMRR